MERYKSIFEEKQPNLEKIIKDNNIKSAKELNDYLIKHYTSYHKQLDGMAKIVQSQVIDLLQSKFK